MFTGIAFSCRCLSAGQYNQNHVLSFLSPAKEISRRRTGQRGAQRLRLRLLQQGDAGDPDHGLTQARDSSRGQTDQREAG